LIDQTIDAEAGQLTAALNAKEWKKVDELLDFGFGKVDSTRQLYYAGLNQLAEKFDREAIHRILALESGPVTDQLKGYALTDAARSGDLDLIRLMKDVNLNYFMSLADSMLEDAYNKGNATLLRYLLEQGASPKELVFTAVKNASDEIFMLLLKDPRSPLTSDRGTLYSHALRAGKPYRGKMVREEEQRRKDNSRKK
jgi:hypothetical protein